MLYQQRYRTETCRLPNWDYRSNGYYFITICVDNRRQQPFGYIRHGIMCVSDMGKIVYDEWRTIARIRQNVVLDTFIVMPDHIHGIVVINDTRPVETHCNASLPHNASLSMATTILRSYYSNTTRTE